MEKEQLNPPTCVMCGQEDPIGPTVVRMVKGWRITGQVCTKACYEAWGHERRVQVEPDAWDKYMKSGEDLGRGY